MSDKSLIEKLGFEPGDTVYVETTPDWYTILCDEEGVELTPGLPATHTHLFCSTRNELAAFLKHNSLDDIEKMLWVSWPKKSSGIKADINEQLLRDLILPFGWVDVKVAAIDDTWSGLKFLRRKTD